VDPTSGLVKEEHRYVDLGTLMSQVGASKQKARSVATLPTSIDWHLAKGTPDEDKNADAYNKINASISDRKEADFLALLTDDTVMDDMTQPTSSKGKDEAKKWLKLMSTAFPDMKASATNTWAAEDFVVGEATLTGTQKGALPGIPATKKSVTLHVVDVLQMKDGKAQHGWVYGDGLEMAAQLGVLKAPKTAAPAPASGGAPKPKDAAKPQDATKPPAAAPSKK
jgi:steroid delta-isomerase-like uncharacterized protein